MTNTRRIVSCLILLLFVPLLMANDDCSSEQSREAVRKSNMADSLMKKQPMPTIDFSMDRYLLSERLTRFNNPNKMTYLYVILPDGTWLKVTIIGKLASTSKRLTLPEDQNSYGSVSAPDEMGTYGHSEPAKVGMTTLGSLIEIGGFLAYVYSETPLMFTGLNKPMVEMTVEATPAERQALLEQLANLKRANTQQ